MANLNSQTQLPAASSTDFNGFFISQEKTTCQVKKFISAIPEKTFTMYVNLKQLVFSHGRLLLQVTGHRSQVTIRGRRL